MKLINLSDITFPKVAIDAEDIVTIEEMEKKIKYKDAADYLADKELAINLIQRSQMMQLTKDEIVLLRNQWGYILDCELAYKYKSELENLYDSLHKDDLEGGIKSKITTKAGKVYTISVSIDEFFKRYDL